MCAGWTEEGGRDRAGAMSALEGSVTGRGQEVSAAFPALMWVSGFLCRHHSPSSEFVIINGSRGPR